MLLTVAKVKAVFPFFGVIVADFCLLERCTRFERLQPLCASFDFVYMKGTSGELILVQEHLCTDTISHSEEKCFQISESLHVISEFRAIIDENHVFYHKYFEDNVPTRRWVWISGSRLLDTFREDVVRRYIKEKLCTASYKNIRFQHNCWFPNVRQLPVHPIHAVETI